jgi:hypothetical protein
LRRRARARGGAVTTVESAADALALLKDDPKAFDLVLTGAAAARGSARATLSLLRVLAQRRACDGHAPCRGVSGQQRAVPRRGAPSLAVRAAGCEHG